MRARKGYGMFCPNCGNQLADGAKFCPKCGNPVGQAQAPQPQPPVAQSPAPAPFPASSPAPAYAPASAPAPAPDPTPKKKPKVIIGVVAGIVVFAAVILTLVLTGVWGGGGQLSSIPVGTYQIIDDYGYVIKFVMGADGTLTFSQGDPGYETPRYSFTTRPVGTVEGSTVFECSNIQTYGGLTLTDEPGVRYLLVPNGITEGNLAGAWALQGEYDGIVHTAYALFRDDGTAILQPNYESPVTFVEGADWWKTFFEAMPEGESYAWRRTGDRTYQVDYPTDDYHYTIVIG